MNTTSSTQNHKRDNTAFWDKRRGVIQSSIGGARIGEGVVYTHGYSILDEIVGEASYFQLMILNATGRLVEPRLAEWIEAAFICVSWPDARIWCNTIGALGGTLRTSTVAGTAAGMLAADSTMYGTLPLMEGVRFIQQALEHKNAGMTAEEIVEQACARYRGKPHITGYARPLASGDERLVAMERVTDKLGFEIDQHLSLAYEIQEVLANKFNETMNINGYYSAFLSDQDFSADEIYGISVSCVNSGVTACHIDAADQPPESFLPLQCDDIEYQGKPPRTVPAGD